MNFIDTSVVVRYLIGDTPEFLARAKTIIEQQAVLVVTDVVLTEVAFVLRSVYNVPREDIIDTLVLFVQRRNIVVFGLAKELVIQGLLLCRPSGRISLPDALIWVAARSASPDAAVIYSFDKRFPAEGIELRTAL